MKVELLKDDALSDTVSVLAESFDVDSIVEIGAGWSGVTLVDGRLAVRRDGDDSVIVLG